MSPDLAHPSLSTARAVLGIPPGADADAIARAFRAAAKRAHPDIAGGEADRFRGLVEAYRQLQAAAAPCESATRARLRRFAGAWA
jgi:curved DNA-binding protein